MIGSKALRAPLQGLDAEVIVGLRMDVRFPHLPMLSPKLEHPGGAMPEHCYIVHVNGRACLAFGARTAVRPSLARTILFSTLSWDARLTLKLIGPQPSPSSSNLEGHWTGGDAP